MMANYDCKCDFCGNGTGNVCKCAEGNASSRLPLLELELKKDTIMNIYEPHTIVSVNLTDAGEIEVIKKYPSNTMYACNPPGPAPDRVVKETYIACDGKIILGETKEGKHTPAHTVNEQIEF